MGLALFLLLSCSTFPANQVTSFLLPWSVGNFTNEWGDHSGDQFLRYDLDVEGSYSTNRGAKYDPVTIRELTFSKAFGLSFIVPNFLASDSTELQFQIRLSAANIKDFSGIGHWDDNRRYTYYIAYSDELLDALLAEIAKPAYHLPKNDSV